MKIDLLLVALPEIAEHQLAEAFGLLVAAELAVGRDREGVLVLGPLDEQARRETPFGCRRTSRRIFAKANRQNR